MYWIGAFAQVLEKLPAAERMSQVQLVEARSKADEQEIESQAKAEAQRMEAESQANAQRLAAQGDADIQRLQTEAEIHRLKERERTAQAYSKHPAQLRMLELEALGELARSGNARIYIGFDKHAALRGINQGDDAIAGGGRVWRYSAFRPPVFSFQLSAFQLFASSLPAFFRTLSGQKPSREDMKKLPGIIKGTRRP